MSNVGWNPFTPGGTGMASVSGMTGLPAESGAGMIGADTTQQFSGNQGANMYGPFGSSNGYGAYGARQGQSQGLSAGEIGAITVGGLAGTAAIAGGAYYGGSKAMKAFKNWRGRAV